MILMQEGDPISEEHILKQEHDELSRHLRIFQTYLCCKIILNSAKMITIGLNFSLKDGC